MILSSKLLNLILHFKLFFQVWEGNGQKKVKQKKTKRYVILNEQFLQQTYRKSYWGQPCS